MKEQFVYSQKNNFSAGELTPTIEGRTDLGLYQNGVKKLINFMILPSGGVMRRHGTRFSYLFATENNQASKKFISVMFSRKLSYMLVFEFFPNKTTCSIFTGGNLYMNTVTLKHDRQDIIAKPKNFSYVVFQGVAYICFGEFYPVFKFHVDPEIVEEFHHYLFEKTKERKEREGQSYEVSSLLSLQDAENFPQKDRMFIIEPLKVNLSYFKTAQYDLKERSFNEVIYGAEPDKINDTLRRTHQAANQNIFEEQAEYIFCRSLAVFENRLWCFGVNKNIHGIWASYKGDFSDFQMAYKSLLEARNPMTAISLTFSSATFDQVLWTIAFSKDMLIGTTDGIYILKEGDRIKGEFVKIHKEIDLPISPIKPVILGKTVFFVEGGNRKINSLYYSAEKRGYQVSSITNYAEHLFVDGIKEIIGSTTPFFVIFAILKNGSFTTFTYSEDLKIMGWAQHHLGGNGFVLSLVSIHAEQEDRLYFHVRRKVDTGTHVREYIEVLYTRFFTAKANEVQKPVYVDCYVDIRSITEHFIDAVINKAIQDDSAFEFHGGLTKLEHLIQEQAEHVATLNLEGMEDFVIKRAFRFSNKLIDGYGIVGDEIMVFLRKYYAEYLPLILETLGTSFVFWRIFGEVYALLESAALGDAECFTKAKKLFEEGHRIGGDIKQNLDQINTWVIPDIVNFGGMMEYTANNAFSFDSKVFGKLKNLNFNVTYNEEEVGIVDLIFGILNELIELFNKVAKANFEDEIERKKLLETAAKINRKVLRSFAKEDDLRKKDLRRILNIFFGEKNVAFYALLKQLSSGYFTKAIFNQKDLVDEAFKNINENTEANDFKEILENTAVDIIKILENLYEEKKTKLTKHLTRQGEIVELFENVLKEKNLSTENKNYFEENFPEELNLKCAILSDFQDVEPAESSMATIEDLEDSSLDSKYAFDLMNNLSDLLKAFKSNVIDICCLLMPSYHSIVLKDILQDENSLKLEKYLLLSKKYYSAFRKIFPDIGNYELATLARCCMPSFSIINNEQIPLIYKDNVVSIVGDEELQDVRLIKDETIKLRLPARFVSIGFGYRSMLQTFPFVFPEEIEHLPKGNTEIGIKIYNTKGGNIEEKTEEGIETQSIANKHISLDDIVRFTDEKKYLFVKEVCNVLSTPYISGWINFLSKGKIKTDVDFTFVVDKPYPVSLMKVYAKSKILPHYYG